MQAKNSSERNSIHWQPKPVIMSLSRFQFFRRQPRISTVINYCTNDYRFIRACIAQAASCTDEVIVPYTDHFYDGSPENQELLRQTIAENKEATFIKFDYRPDIETNAQYWVTYARKTGWEHTSQTDYILFLDADEIIDAKRFREWLNRFRLSKFNILKLANYYYFRTPQHQANTYEDSAILVKKSQITESMLMDFEDRNMPWKAIQEPKKRMVYGTDGKPMIHHYSWVRTREEMLKKVKTWGHNHERPWEQLVNQEFAGPFSGTDFVHGYSYRTVTPFIDL